MRDSSRRYAALATWAVTKTTRPVSAVYFSSRVEPGVTFPFGLLNLDTTALSGPVVLQGDGFGEATVPVLIPLGVPMRATLALQAIVANPTQPLGFVLSNPEQIAVR